MTPADDFDSQQIAAFILAGGRSSRMGTDKARLVWRGRLLVEWLCEQMRPLTRSVSIVVKSTEEYADLGVPMIVDSTSERATVHGIAAALRAPGPPWRLLLACDMPGIDAHVVRHLWRQAQQSGVGSYPRQANHHEPLPSLWHHAVHRRLEASWGMRAQDWLERAGLTAWQVDADDQLRLRNVNTPEEGQAWCDQGADGTSDG